MKPQQIGDAGWVEEVILHLEEGLTVKYGFKLREDNSLTIKWDVDTFEKAVLELLRAYEDSTMLKITRTEPAWDLTVPPTTQNGGGTSGN